MVASANGEVYSFQPSMGPDEGPQSSEEGSGMHSPVLYGAPGGDSFRYQHDPAYHEYQQQQIHLPPYPAQHYLPHPDHHLHHHDPRLQPPPPAPAPAPAWAYGPRLPEHDYPRAPGPPVPVPLAQPQLVVERPTEQSPQPEQRKREGSNVVIACRQCRARKIRCDSTRPGCNNCARRNNQCEYDAVPKRRGPDKRPGTRQRSCKKRPPPDGTNPAPPKRKKTSSAAPAASSSKDMAQSTSRSPPQQHPAAYPYATSPTEQPPQHPGLLPTVKVEHSPTYRRDFVYSQDSVPRNINLQPLNGILAEQLDANWARLLKANPVQVIIQEVTFVVEGTGHYLSFINLDHLKAQLWDAQFRVRHIHPGFIWAALALANLMRASAVGQGAAGMHVALGLFREAKAALDIAWADPTYAYAALIIALFESSAQPNYSHASALNALVELDDYIHQMRLTMSDHHHPEVTKFSGGVPVIFYPSDRENLDHRRVCPCQAALSPASASATVPASTAGASASSAAGAATSGPTSPGSPVDIYGSPTSHPSSAHHPAVHNPSVVGPGGARWDPSWGPEQVRAEEIRRMCWSALSLVSAFLAQAATDNRRMPVFHLSEARSFQLLFPGEEVDRLDAAFNHPDGLTPKESVWALYCRSMLLWNWCSSRYRHIGQGPLHHSPHGGPGGPGAHGGAGAHGGPGLDEDGALSEELADALSEAQGIDESLDMHKCVWGEGVVGCSTREYTHNIRVVITQAMRTIQGLERPSPSGRPGLFFKRAQAAEWVAHQDKVVRDALGMCGSLGSVESVGVTERPWRVQWFLHQLSLCLQLWEQDRTLKEALVLGGRLMQVVDTMNYLWDCQENRIEASHHRARLTEACRMTGVEPPYDPAPGRQLSRI